MGAVISMLGAFFLVVGYVVWIIHNALPGNGNATSWDLRSVATPHLLTTFLVTVLMFFVLGFWAGYRTPPKHESLKRN
jgi:hypothetical protein